MAVNTMKNGDIRLIGMSLMRVWEESKNDIKLSGTSLYRLLAIKRKIEQQASLINEAFVEIGLSLGGEDSGDGQLKIPTDKISEANERLSEVAAEEFEIEYTPIELKETDYLPPDLMELFFDFIQI